MGSRSPNRKNCIRNINYAIHKLQHARLDTKNGNFEQAENHLTDSLQDISEALKCINPSVPIPCDPAGAIPLTSGLNGAPPGTSNLRPGDKYITPVFGYVITWEGDTITVCEAPNPSNVWSISCAPLVLTSGNGTQQCVPSLCGFPQAAAIGLNEGTALVFSASVVNGPVTQARYVSNSVIQVSSSYQGFDTTKTEFYFSIFSGQELQDSCYTLNEIFGV